MSRITTIVELLSIEILSQSTSPNFLVVWRGIIRWIFNSYPRRLQTCNRWSSVFSPKRGLSFKWILLQSVTFQIERPPRYYKCVCQYTPQILLIVFEVTVLLVTCWIVENDKSRGRVSRSEDRFIMTFCHVSRRYVQPWFPISTNIVELVASLRRAILRLDHPASFDQMYAFSQMVTYAHTVCEDACEASL